MCIYQFLIAVRQDGNVLQNEDGETTRYNPHNTDTLKFRLRSHIRKNIRDTVVLDGY